MDMRAKILSAETRRERVELGEPIGHCWIHAITEADRSDLEASVIDPTTGEQNALGLRHFTARLLIASVCDDDGRPVFTADDVDAIRQLPSQFVRSMYEVARRLSGLDSQDIETLVGNSDSPAADGSPTG